MIAGLICRENLYGGLESSEQLAEAYQSDFLQGVEIVAEEHSIYSSYKPVTYSKVGEWRWNQDDITCHMSAGWPEGSGEMAMLSLRIYNTDYDPYAQSMEAGTVFLPEPEFTFHEIEEQTFIDGYTLSHPDESPQFIYNQEPGDYRFYEVLIKDDAYCPQYPLDLKLYLAINLSLSENNSDHELHSYRASSAETAFPSCSFAYSVYVIFLYFLKHFPKYPASGIPTSSAA